MWLIKVKGDGNLVFPPFRAEDYRQEVHAQVYICMAKNRVGVIHSRDVNVRAGMLTVFQNNLHLLLLNNPLIIIRC